MGSHWVLTLLYLKSVLYWPEDDRLRSKHAAIMWSEFIYNITLLIYCCVLTEHNTLCKFVSTQRDGLCQKKNDVKKLTVAFHNVAMVPESLTTSRRVHWSCILCDVCEVILTIIILSAYCGYFLNLFKVWWYQRYSSCNEALRVRYRWKRRFIE